MKRMKLSMVASPPSEKRLRALKQLGLDHAVHYDMNDLPDSLSDLKAIADHYARHGLSWKISEGGPAIDQIVMGKDGAQAQTERYKRILGLLGQVGVEVIAYNFMPQVSADAMVVRTSMNARTRGGAQTSSFRLTDVNADTMRHEEVPIPPEQMWDNLERFLHAVLPAAEEAGVKLAMHPDDPPIANLCGLNRIMGSKESFDRLLDISASPSNGITFCVGCFSEMGEDIISLLERYRSQIHFIHVRNISGTPHDFIETFPDDGQVDLAAVFRKLHEIGFGGYLRSDHAPRLATESEASPDGYSMHGHMFTIGYLRGLEEASRQSGAARS
ncbi:mannonate dehydratase [Mesorhizobium sp. M3A.F.Ca.ET.201.01.1.1]|uniref:mannonate dehydratase n=1 Tax=Mesorhizobium sp. M3A.F.Ca.ET.201.01.1.1 TaxID=2563946 RepID=UPI0010934839|nr:mannonate dehydratase [Mesorhizobium sp. M3A.F.Ca.ET.201.01.1.1]TGS71746.1 mannonate dehydratase [Mesorhizobium sp. M3A.F.Ca.ET.201.01.1.1]